MKPLGPATRSAIAVSLPALALIASAWIFIGSLIHYERDDTIREVERQNANLALAFEEHTVRTLRSVEQVLQFVLHEYGRHGEVDVDELAKAAGADADFMTAPVVLNAEGNVAIGGTDGASTSLADREFFRFHRDHPGTGVLIGRPVQGRLTGRNVFTISQRIERPGGGFAGVVSAGVTPDYFGSFYGRMDIGPHSIVQLIGLDGFVRVRRIGDKVSFGQDVRESTVLSLAAKSPSGNFMSRGNGSDGQRRLQSYRVLREYGLVLAVGAAEDEVLAPFYARRELYLWTAGIFTLLVLAAARIIFVFLQVRRTALLRQRADEARFRATFDQSAVSMAHVGLDGKIVRVNARLCEMTGYGENELLGRDFTDFKFEDDRAAAHEARKAMLDGKPLPAAEHRYRRKDGGVLWANIAISLVRDAQGRPDYFVVVAQDVTAQRRAQETIFHQATHDLLTDLPNRAMFQDRLLKAMSQARRKGWTVGVMFMDLDKFKQVNDTLGHAAGDALLKEVAARLARVVRGSDTAARVGGDEFAVVLGELADAADAVTVARKILDAMAAPITLEGRAYVVTVSLGITLFPRDGEDVETLLRNADDAMFRAKQAGRNCFRHHDRSLDEAPVAAAA